MVSVNFGNARLNVNSNFEKKRFQIEEDSYNFEIVKIGDIFTQNKEYKDDKTGKMVMKETENFVIEFKIDDDKLNVHLNEKGEQEDIVLYMYLTTKITQATAKTASSKLYELLDKAGLLKDVEKESALWSTFDNPLELNKAFIKYLEDHLIKKRGKLMTRNSKDKKTNEIYSVVDKVTKFV